MMLRDFFKTAGLLFFALFWGGSAYALQVAYPLDGSYVTKSKYLIVQAGDNPELTGITIEINGIVSDIINISSKEYRATFGDMLVVEPLFDSGVNRIVVTGYLEGEKSGSASATVYYLDRDDQLPPSGFKRETFHLPEREAPCGRCHSMNPGEADLVSPDPRENACGSCHTRMLDQSHVHGPAGVYECTYCHDHDSQPDKYQARLGGSGALCMECHDDKLMILKQEKFIHGPFEAGLCMVCHDPHASSHSGQLVASTNELCLSCHSKVDLSIHVIRASSGEAHPLEGVPNPAVEGETLSCASCHDPHGAPGKALLRWGAISGMSICVNCHKK